MDAFSPARRFEKNRNAPVEEARNLSSSYVLMDLSTPQVDSFVAQAAISKPIDEALRRVLAQKSVIQADVSRMAELESERDSIFDDQQRLRENIKSLTGGAEEKALLQRYTQQLNQQETRLEELRKQTAEIETKRNAEQ